MLLQVLRMALGLGLAILAAVGAAGTLGLPLIVRSDAFEAPILSIVRSALPYAPFLAALGLIAIAISERARLRQLLYWLLAGAVVAMLSFHALQSGEALPAAMFGGMAPLKFVTAGAFGGFVYWLVAGRRAGALWALVAGEAAPGTLGMREEQRRCTLCAVLWLALGLVPLALLGWQMFHNSSPSLAGRIAANAEADAARKLAGAGHPELAFKVHGYTGHVTGSVADAPAKDAAFAKAKEVLAPFVGVPGVVAVLENDIIAKDDTDPRVAAENARIRAAMEDEARKRAEAERLAAEIEAKRKAEEEAARLAAEAEAKRKAEQEALAKAEADRVARAKAEAARLAAEMEAKRKAEGERLAAEAEAKRIAAEEEARAKAEAERLAAEVEAKRIAAEKEVRAKAEAERLAAEVEAKRIAAEEEARAKAEAERLAAEAEAKRKSAEEEARQREAAERIAAEIEKKRKAFEDAQIRAETKRTAQVEAERKAVEAALAAAESLAVEAAAKRKADAERARQKTQQNAAAVAPDTVANVAEGSASATSNAPEPGAAASANDVRSCFAELEALTRRRKIFFKSSSSELRKVHAKLLDAVALLAKTCPGMTIVVSGHTDFDGNEVANQILSEERAEAVRAALVERGVDSKHLEVRAFAWRQPSDGVVRRYARAADRRVEFSAIAHLEDDHASH